VKRAVAIVAILAAIALVHGLNLPSTWDADDGLLLDYAVRYSPLQYFFVPAYTHGLSPSNVTPWLALAYDANLALFGLQAKAFYVHQLAWIAACAVLLYFVMRLWIAPLDAVAAALLFVLGATTEFAATHLMVAHYVDGLAFALLALLSYVRAIRARSRVALAASALAYAIALTCKELYVPLPLVLLVLPEADWRMRARYCVPHGVLVVLYALWRRAVLGGFVGGYQGPGLTVDDLSNTAKTFAALPNALLGHGAPMIAAVVVVVAVAIALLWRRQLNAILTLVLLGVLLLPLVPLGVLGAIVTPDRFFFVVWLALACAIAWGASTVVASPALRIAVYAIVAFAAYENLVAVRASAGPQSAVARIYAFVVNGDPSTTLVIDKGQPYVNNQLNGLIYTYGALAPERRHATVAGRDEVSSLAPTQRLFVWSPQCDCIAPTTADDVRRSAVHEVAPTSDRPAPRVEIEYQTRDRTMRWKAGPYTDGIWTIRFENAPGLWTIKYDAWRRTGGANVFWPDAERPFRFFVRFESPEGWAVRTPVLSFTPATDGRLSWSPPSSTVP
jgi:hypothetical protein